MIGGTWANASFVAFTTRPVTTTLVIAIVLTVAAWALLARARFVSAPPRPVPIGDERPLADDVERLEPPAVVALLTNGYHVPPSTVAATVLDLAARGWIRLASADDELIVFTSGNGRDGDVLRPFEQQVLNHLTARSFDGITSASTMANSQHRLKRRWWRRYRTDVVRTARRLGLTRRRFSVPVLAPPAGAGLLGTLFTWLSWRSGETGIEVRDSLAPRGVWIATAAALLVLFVRMAVLWASDAERPTELGERRACRWIGHRRRLLAKIPERASVLAPPHQQLALAHGLVMGVCEHVGEQIPIAPEDDRRAWSDAGGTPHTVRVRYPIRPCYGRHPLVAALGGAAVLAVAVLARRFFLRVADGEALQSIIDDFPDQADIVERVADVLAIAAFVPMVWAVWALGAGLIDSVWTRERRGAVVRARRPGDVVRLTRLLRPLTRRDHFSVFVAVDDGRRRSVTSWVANERTAAPQGAQARVRATPLLGYVRASEPVGTSTPRTRR